MREVFLVSAVRTAIGGFGTLETAVNVTWGKPSRNFVMNKLFSVAMLFLIGTLLVLSLGVTTVLQWAGSFPSLTWLASRRRTWLTKPSSRATPRHRNWKMPLPIP